MAALSGAMALILACALPGRLSLGAEGNLWEGPCEEQQRFRQNLSEPEVGWRSTAAILFGFGALMMLLQHFIRSINKNQCPQERKECETQKEDFQELCKKTDRGPPSTGGSQALACSPAREELCPSMCNQIQQAYARQLACMEQQLAALLYEVQSQRSTLDDTLIQEECLRNMTEKGSENLRITVYEIADCEDSGHAQPKRRKRQFE